MLARVRAFNRVLIAAGEAGRDLSEVTRRLDPDPGRYLWVDEGGGRLGARLDELEALLVDAPPLPGHVRHPTRRIGARGSATRPAIAGAPDGRLVLAWISWVPDRGEQVVAMVLDGARHPVVPAQDVSGAASDCFRPTAAFDATGRPWVFYARAQRGIGGTVAVYARRHDGLRWGPEERVSTTQHPSFNQDVVAHADGSVECIWQGREAGGFGAFTRRWRNGAWREPRRLDGDSAGNVWDPAAAALRHSPTA